MSKSNKNTYTSRPFANVAPLESDSNLSAERRKKPRACAVRRGATLRVAKTAVHCNEPPVHKQTLNTCETWGSLLTWASLLHCHQKTHYCANIMTLLFSFLLLQGILIMLMVFSVLELLIAMSFSVLTRQFDCCDCEEWC